MYHCYQSSMLYSRLFCPSVCLSSKWNIEIHGMKVSVCASAHVCASGLFCVFVCCRVIWISSWLWVNIARKWKFIDVFVWQTKALVAQVSQQHHRPQTANLHRSQCAILQPVVAAAICLSILFIGGEPAVNLEKVFNGCWKFVVPYFVSSENKFITCQPAVEQFQVLSG